MTLAARFKDLELFVVGIQQQLLRRQERLANTAPHMQTGTDYNIPDCMLILKVVQCDDKHVTMTV